MSETGRESFAKSAWRIEMYHRALKQQCLIDRAQCRRLRPVLNHIVLLEYVPEIQQVKSINE